jgi:hypothetical protein
VEGRNHPIWKKAAGTPGCLAGSEQVQGVVGGALPRMNGGENSVHIRRSSILPDVHFKTDYFKNSRKGPMKTPASARECGGGGRGGGGGGGWMVSKAESRVRTRRPGKHSPLGGIGIGGERRVWPLA